MTDKDLESISLLLLEEGAAGIIADILEASMIIWAFDVD